MIRCYHDIFCCWNEISIENAASWLYFVDIFFPERCLFQVKLESDSEDEYWQNFGDDFSQEQMLPNTPESRNSFQRFLEHQKKGSVNDYVHKFCRVSVEKKWNNMFGIAEQNTFEPQKKWWNWKQSTGFGISARLWYPRLVLIFYPKCQEMWDFNLSNISKKA